MKRLLGVASVIAFLVLCSHIGVARAHFRHCQPADISCKSHNVWHASLLTWCGNSYRPCYNGVKAHAVASCETGRTFNRYATNGQYHGLFQMGSGERARCGQTLGRDPWKQARAAYCWWRLTGWGAWACA